MHRFGKLDADGWGGMDKHWIADLNADGQKDIIVGEMTLGGWDFPLNRNPEIRGYLNRGDLEFEKRVLEDGWGVHEMGVVPGWQGKTLIYAADEIQPQKRPGMNTHVSRWTIEPIR